MKGPEAGYLAIPIAMVPAAMTLLNASDLPKVGKVFTSGASFSRNKLIDSTNVALNLVSLAALKSKHLKN